MDKEKLQLSFDEHFYIAVKDSEPEIENLMKWLCGAKVEKPARTSMGTALVISKVFANRLIDKRQYPKTWIDAVKDRWMPKFLIEFLRKRPFSRFAQFVLPEYTTVSVKDFYPELLMNNATGEAVRKITVQNGASNEKNNNDSDERRLWLAPKIGMIRISESICNACEGAHIAEVRLAEDMKINSKTLNDRQRSKGILAMENAGKVTVALLALEETARTVRALNRAAVAALIDYIDDTTSPVR